MEAARGDGHARHVQHLGPDTTDVEALRKFRVGAQWSNWIKDLSTEQYQLSQEQAIYPKNLYADRAP